MGFEKVTSGNGQRGGRGALFDAPARFFFAYRSDKRSDSDKQQCASSFYVAKSSIKDLRWIAGDKIDFYFDIDTGRVGARRAAGGCSQVTQNHKSPTAKNWKLHVGRELTSILRDAWSIDASKSVNVFCSVTIDGDMLILERIKVVS